jgi:hypothetical protein
MKSARGKSPPGPSCQLCASDGSLSAAPLSHVVDQLSAALAVASPLELVATVVSESDPSVPPLRPPARSTEIVIGSAVVFVMMFRKRANARPLVGT